MGPSVPGLEGRNILLGVSGGIAAYKAVDLASRLTASGAVVRTVMTANACRLIGPPGFEAVTGQCVYTSMWRSSPGEYKIGHISLAEWAAAVVVAPATADIIAKFALGICDDLLSTILCASWNKPVLIAPAMNTNMWSNPTVQRNVETLRQAGVSFTGPAAGRLACGSEGPGRMSEPADIIEAITRLVSKT